VRNTGIHAAGIIIAPKDLTELIPVATAKDSDLWVTQIEGSSIEESGVIKMDFLGLKNLSIIKTALELIKQNHGIEINIDEIPLDDKETFQLYQRGETNATFQFESAGMQKSLRELKPDVFGDLIAMNALYRPGPIQYIPSFIKRKHGVEKIEYDLPEMEEYLADTYGITVYQEQVMLLSQKLAGFSKGDADVLRKAMGKKQIAILNRMKAQFIDGALKNGHPKDKLEKIWADWEAFAQYAFNKSHSTCYALVAYQTAYLKVHYTGEYMAAVLNHAGSIDKITFYMEECKRMGIKVLGCDINESQKGFAVNKNGEIRFGFGGLKGVGDAAIESIMEERQKNGVYKDIFDFIKRINQRTVNKKTIENLVYSGCFDCFKDLNRAQYFAVQPGETVSNIERIIKFGSVYQNSAQTTMNSLFGDMEMPDVATPKILPVTEWSLVEKLNYEKEITGIYISGHPLDNFRFELEHYGFMPINKLNEIKENTDYLKKSGALNYRIAGLVTDAQHLITKNGKEYGRLTIEDFSGKIELTLWRDDYIKNKSYLEKGLVLAINGFFKPRWNDENMYDFNLLATPSAIMLLDNVKTSYTRFVDMEIPLPMLDTKMVEFFSDNAKHNAGNATLKFKIVDPDAAMLVNLYNMDKGITMNDELINFLYQNPEINVHVGLAG